MHIFIKFILLAGGYGLVHSSLYAQNGTVASGGDGSTPNGSISYSIGQVDYVNNTSATGSIHQGLQQPYEIYQYAGIENPLVQLELALYPNPTSDVVQLVTNDLSQDIRYMLFDMNGKLIDQQPVNQSPLIIPMQHLAASSYLLHIYMKNAEIKTYQIIKK